MAVGEVPKDTGTTEISFEDMESNMLSAYKSDTCQEYVKGILDMLRLTTFMSEKGTASMSEG